LKRTPELITEGIARELVNRIQNLRKKMKLAVDDKIELLLGSEVWPFRAAFEAHKAYIMEEVQAEKIGWENVDHLYITTPIQLEEGVIHVVINKR